MNGTLPRPPMSQHTLAALCGGYTRYLSQQTRLSEEHVLDHFYTEKGLNPERDLEAFRKWASQKVFIMDQLGRDPFGEMVA